LVDVGLFERGFPTALFSFEINSRLRLPDLHGADGHAFRLRPPSLAPPRVSYLAASGRAPIRVPPTGDALAIGPTNNQLVGRC
jgi:hypothetical protein